MNKRFNKIIACVSLFAIALVLFFPVADKVSAPDYYSDYINSIDEKTNTVLRLIAASTITSAGLSAIPDDTATPIADKLADFSEYFLLILCVLYAEKYLLSLIPIGVFRILSPIMFTIAIIAIVSESKVLAQYVKKLLIINLALFFVIPLSIKVSDRVYETYRQSIDDTIAVAENTPDDTGLTETPESKNSFWSIISNIPGTIVDAKNNITEKASNILSKFVESIAVMIVTSCIIPILVLLIFMWIIKEVTGFDLPEYANTAYQKHRANRRSQRKKRFTETEQDEINV